MPETSNLEDSVELETPEDMLEEVQEKIGKLQSKIQDPSFNSFLDDILSKECKQISPKQLNTILNKLSKLYEEQPQLKRELDSISESLTDLKERFDESKNTLKR